MNISQQPNTENDYENIVFLVFILLAFYNFLFRYFFSTFCCSNCFVLFFCFLRQWTNHCSMIKIDQSTYYTDTKRIPKNWHHVQLYLFCYPITVKVDNWNAAVLSQRCREYFLTAKLLWIYARHITTTSYSITI